MRSLAITFLIACSATLYSCNGTPASTASGSGQTQNPQTFSLAGYGENVDSTYYKVWSDSSWEEFYMDTTMGGTTYSVLLDNSGYEYFYGPDGYSGFRPYGGDVIMFDSTMASLPDSMVEDEVYVSQTTFSVQGVSYVLADQETLVDTATVPTAFGTFDSCLVIQMNSSMTGGGQALYSATDYWLAKGPSDIERLYDTGQDIVMAYGVVNGIGWGVSTGVAKARATYRIDAAGPGKPSLVFHRYSGDPVSLARAVLNGVIRGRQRPG